MKFIYTILLILFSGLVHDENSTPNHIINILIKEKIIVRDSGKEVTKEFLSGCIQSHSPTHYKLECDDVLFTHFISSFEQINDKSTIILITEDGASVENRWVFQIQDSGYADIKNKLWPNITDTLISQLMIEQTGNEKYTSKYISSVVHSSYRVQHTKSKILRVISGIPDESYGTELGVIEWDGRKFNFVPKSS